MVEIPIRRVPANELPPEAANDNEASDEVLAENSPFIFTADDPEDVSNVEEYVRDSLSHIQDFKQRKRLSEVKAKQLKAIQEIEELGIVLQQRITRHSYLLGGSESGEQDEDFHKSAEQIALNLEIFHEKVEDFFAAEDDNSEAYDAEEESEESVMLVSTQKEDSAQTYPKEVATQKSHVYAGQNEKAVAASETASRYEQIREGWIAAKAEYGRLKEAYEAAYEAHYQRVAENTSLFSRLKSTFGFKPKFTDEETPELAEMRSEMLAATAEYNKFARAMVQAREVVGKERFLEGAGKNKGLATAEDAEKMRADQERKQRVLERYQRMQARMTVVDTLDKERQVQEQTVENLSIKPPKFVAKHKRATRYLGAAVLGAATAGSGAMLLGAGQAVLRAFGAGAITGAAARVIDARTEKKISELAGRENQNNLKEGSRFEREIAAIGERLRPRTINDSLDDAPTAEEFEEMRQRLQEIYNQVDAEQRKRIAAILATAIGSGIIIGGGIESLLDSDSDVSTGTSDDTSAESGFSFSDIPEDSSSAAQDKVFAPENLTEDAAEGSQSIDKSAFIVPEGFTVWDYYEGQTIAEKPAVMNSIPAAEQQEFIKQIEIALNEDAALREKVGLGETADVVYAGDTINLSALDELAEKIAADKEVIAESSAQIESLTQNLQPEESPDVTEDGVEQANVNNGKETPPQTEDTSSAAEVATREEVGSGTEADSITVGSVSEVLQEEYGDNPETVYEYVVNYEGGPNAFLDQFTEEFVAQHQSHHLERGGFLGLGAPKYADAFAYMKGMTISEIEVIANGDAETQQQFFEESGIHPEDFASWVNQIGEARESRAVSFSDNDRLEETMQAIYIQQKET